MAADLAAARLELATALRAAKADFPVYTTPPDEPLADDDNPELGSAYPLVYVLPGEPYIDFPEGTPFGHAVMHCNVSVVSAPGTSDKEADQVDDLLGSVMDAVLELDDWQVDEVQQPGRIVIENDSHLACPIPMSRLIKLT